MVGVIRNDIIYKNFKKNKFSKKIIVFRDPRDKVISEFNSFAYHHSPPPKENVKEYKDFYGFFIYLYSFSFIYIN